MKNLTEVLLILIVITIVYSYNEWRDYKTDNKISVNAVTDIKNYSDGETSILLYEKGGEWRRVKTEYSSEKIFVTLGN